MSQTATQLPNSARKLNGGIILPWSTKVHYFSDGSADGWNRVVDSLDLDGVDTRIIERFRREVQTDSDLFQELERVCEMFPRRRDVYPQDMTQLRNSPALRPAAMSSAMPMGRRWCTSMRTTAKPKRCRPRC
jgi:hypothetical protein